jgi:hypothetical protein
MVEEAAEKFRRYPALVGELLELLNLAAQVDREVGEVNGSARITSIVDCAASN